MEPFEFRILFLVFLLLFSFLQSVIKAFYLRRHLSSTTWMQRRFSNMSILQHYLVARIVRHIC